MLEVRRVAAAECLLEGLVRGEIDQADAGLQHAFRVGSGLVSVERFIAIVDLGWCRGKGIGPRHLRAQGQGSRTRDGWLRVSECALSIGSSLKMKARLLG